MRVIETFTGSAKGERTEDLIVETPHYLGVFDGVTGTRGTGEVEGRTLGQWASALAGEALRELPANAALRDFADLATKKIADFRAAHGLAPTDRLASTAIILPRRLPLRVWCISDSGYGYRDGRGEWVACPQGKYYDEVTHANRRIVVLQELMLLGGEAKTAQQRARVARAGWESMQPAVSKQLLFANHPDPAQKLGFGLLTGTRVPDHHLRVFDLPAGTREVALCSDGLCVPPPTAQAGREMLDRLRAEDPFLAGDNHLGFIGGKGGFVQMDGTVAAWYDDVAYVRADVS